MTTRNLITSIVLSFLSLQSTWASLTLDVEKDPIPIVEITLVLPQGRTAESLQDSVASSFLSEILISGTMSKDKQSFNDALAQYGADYSFTLGTHYSYWTLSFPFFPEKDYAGLIQLLAENWETPRFLNKEFELVKLKMVSGLKSSLDSDYGLLSQTLSRWIDEKLFSTPSIFLDDLEKFASLKNTQSFFEKHLRNTEKAWAGVIAPAESLSLVEKILSTVFHRQGKISTGVLKSKMASQVEVTPKTSSEKTFLLLDKKGQAQTVMGLRALSKTDSTADNELAFAFGDYLLFSNGLDSYYATVIRSEKGLAYTVRGSATSERGRRMLGFTSNPQANRKDEAFSTVADLMKQTFEGLNPLEVIPEDRWQRVLSGFKNQKALENGLPNQRLSQRMSVVTGGQSYELAKSDPSDWEINRNEVNGVLKKHWETSTKIMGAVGSAAELKKLIKRDFPGYKIHVIPYKKSIYSQSIR